ncbi:MAG: TolC family protein [Bacteroidota bacterium]
MNIKNRGLLFSAVFLIVATASAQTKLEVEDIVVMALERSYDVQLARNTATASKTDAKNAKGLFIPDVTLNGARNKIYQKSHSELPDGAVNDTKPEAIQLQYSAQATWTIFDGLKMFATYNQLQNVAAVNTILVTNQMSNTMASVIGNYYNIVAQKQQLKALNEQISVAEERIKLAERKLEVGSGIKTEWLQAKLDQNAFKTQVLQQEALILQTKANLNTLSGSQLPEEFEVSDTIPLNLGLSVDEIFDGIESTNPLLMAARGNIEVAKFNLKAQVGNRFPIINLTSSYNYNSQNYTVPPNALSPPLTQTRSVQLGVTGTWFLVNNFAVTDAIQLARINFSRQQIVYEQQKALAFNGVRAAYANYDNARKTLAIEEENIKYARENVNILLESFKRGIATMIDLRTAQQSIVDAYNRLTTARYNAKVSETELLRLKGALLR